MEIGIDIGGTKIAGGLVKDGRIVKQFLGEPDFEALHALLERELNAG